MAMINCPECGKEVSDKAPVCINCGIPIALNIPQEQPPQPYQNNPIIVQVAQPTSSVMQCPKCYSSNITFQREQTGNVGGSLSSYRFRDNRKGCLYWIFIGWWFWVFKLIFHVATLGIFLLFRRRRGKVTGKTVSGTKNINQTMAICQNCGNSWKV